MSTIAAAAAAALAAAGFSVFPCGTDKAPVVAGGFKATTADLAVAHRLFRRPGVALVGVATGEPSVVVVLDLDGPAGLAWAEAHRHLLPETLIVRTRRGGLHHWFRLDGAPPPSTAGRLGAGVDTRGRGGYAIAWDAAALVHGRALMAPWPTWLSDALAPPPAPPAPPPRPAVRLVMLHHLSDPDGLPRPGLLVPGRRVPLPFRTVAAAMRAKAALEARA
jgi:hypothetical protein